ncbi:response regulator transcription factor [Paenibacillus physcomitrellae]|uniref:DNA-binding response regulator n=1 Tax=Paenibacillus physcomitrellae TaxID=1619311 RepID=A0ABQ1FS37_9BACL|nr:response regulator [Paenibacillus physcomitrellae]GGA28842.1 DNA-binding response regulator [Paenibacillus physcomitrellae]
MHILIVDDERIIRNGLKNMLLSYHTPFASIRLAENGEQAMELIRQDPPNLVITDIRMPKMDGLELCKRIHKSYNFITVVVLSGFAEFEYAKQCMTYGVKEYLLKPVVKADIHELLDKLLEANKKGVLTPTQSEKYLDEMTEHIWQLRLQELDGVLEQWLCYCRGCTDHPSQLKELLEDSFQAVLDRLKAKGHGYTEPAPYIQESPLNDVDGRFREKIRELTDELAMRRGGFKDLMAEAKSYIEQNIAKEITLEEVANLVGLTPNYFSLYFKKTTGTTFINYRMKKRIELAEQLLALPHYRIVDVAHEIGYEDYSHFAKTFRKIKGLTPTEFRSRLGIK